MDAFLGDLLPYVDLILLEKRSDKVFGNAPLLMLAELLHHNIAFLTEVNAICESILLAEVNAVCETLSNISKAE